MGGGIAQRRELSGEHNPIHTLWAHADSSGIPSPPAPAARRLLLPRPPGAGGGRAGDPRDRRARSVPFAPPARLPWIPRRGASRLEGALAPRNRAQQVPRLPPPRRGERGRAGAGEEEESGRRRREVGSQSWRARPARQVGTGARGFRKALRSDKYIPGTGEQGTLLAPPAPPSAGRQAGRLRRGARSSSSRGRRGAAESGGLGRRRRAAEPMSGGG